MMKTTQNTTPNTPKDTAVTTTQVPYEMYEQEVRERKQLQQAITTAFLQKHMYDLAASDHFPGLSMERYELMKKAAENAEDMEKLADVTSEQFSIIATYFYYAALKDAFAYSGAFTNLDEIIGAHDVTLAQLAESSEGFPLLDTGVHFFTFDDEKGLHSTLDDIVKMKEYQKQQQQK